MILETAYLDVKQGENENFLHDFKKAVPLIKAIPGFLSLGLSLCLENSQRYLLQVEWRNLEDHVVGFRTSKEYLEWKKLLHHYYEPFPEVLHFEKIDL